MAQLKLEDLQAYVGAYPKVPVYKEIFSDIRTTISILKVLKRVSKTAFLLESADNKEQWGRYSFLGFDPVLEVACKDGRVTVKGAITQVYEQADPNEVIRRIMSEYKSPIIPGLPPFTGGLVGYFGYEYIKYSEPSLRAGFEAQQKRIESEQNGIQSEGTQDNLQSEENHDAQVNGNNPSLIPQLNDVDMLLFDKVVAIDHYKKKIILIANIGTDELETNYYKAQTELDSLARLLATGEEADVPGGELLGDFEDEYNEDQFIKAVGTVKQHIQEGDIFQGVLSNARRAPFKGSLLNAYRVLRTMNPSPYMFYLSSPSLELTGASPETLVKVTGRRIDTFPIAGTMPRGATPEEDERYEEILKNDEKELAEHNMLVDLGRNDLGRVSEFGSVKVTTLREVQRFSHVMHICSAVTGTLQAQYDALDALKATLPAGTLSGAPKIRAVQILQELEPSKRGVYAGAIGYLSMTGNMDTCIGIRMAVAKDGVVEVRDGAGIVRDSVPRKEYEETRNKARSMIEAIRRGREVTTYDIVD
ncbi:MAG: chorismate-binding protein [Veillonella sp.]|uniref:anthranilate synthase component I family protein n=1 Tax=Veillonella sp. TaxID=1926307 RepID=UPI0025DF2056|nr:chorismate-binding protein [Veillonella sp.]MBS4913067.1 chorismate-binding protein [Veillonella sp.]